MRRLAGRLCRNATLSGGTQPHGTAWSAGGSCTTPGTAPHATPAVFSHSLPHDDVKARGDCMRTKVCSTWHSEQREEDEGQGPRSTGSAAGSHLQAPQRHPSITAGPGAAIAKDGTELMLDAPSRADGRGDFRSQNETKCGGPTRRHHRASEADGTSAKGRCTRTMAATLSRRRPHGPRTGE